MVKQGYKQTEIGVIPKEWSVLKLQDCASFLDHKRIPIKDSDRKKMRGSYPYYGASGIIDYVDSYIFDGTYILLGEDGANIIDRSSRLAFIVNGKCWINNHAHVILPTPSIDIYFLSEYLESIKYDEYNTGTAQPKLNREKCNGIPIAVPSLNEQKRIAEALSDVDSMISSLEKLIAKKKAVKQGAMQELLTGKKRLPGFDGEWKAIQLGSVSKIKTGDKNNEQKTDDGKYPFFVRSQQVERINSYSYDGEAILIPGEGNIGQIFHYINGKFDWHQRVYKISDFSEFVCGKYVYYQMKFSFGEHALKNTVKATVDSLRLPTFEQFEFLIPPIVEEQIAISSILSDMDNEIEALEHKLEKTRQIKQGMMQQLLTGKIRLV